MPEVTEILWKLDRDFSHVAAWQPHANRLEHRSRQAFGFLLADDQMLTDATQELLAVEYFRRRFAVPGDGRTNLLTSPGRNLMSSRASSALTRSESAHNVAAAVSAALTPAGRAPLRSMCSRTTPHSPGRASLPMAMWLSTTETPGTVQAMRSASLRSLHDRAVPRRTTCPSCSSMAM